MPILLINPSGGYHHEYPPLGLLYIAAFLRDSGYKVGFLDEGALPFPEMEYLEAVDSCSPSYIGISIYTTNISRSYQIIRQIKEKNPDIIIIVGGPHATAMPEVTLSECPEIDFLVAGEGEHTFKELLDDLKIGGRGYNVKGVYSRSPQDGKIRFCGERPYLECLDELPFPAYDLVEFESYQKNPISLGEKVASVISSRGCPFCCNFCNKAVFKSLIRRRSSKNVVAEIKLLVERFGIDEIYFQDDLFALDKSWLYQFIDDLRNEKIKIPWRMLARVDVLDKKDFNLLRDAGCYLVQFGVESGNDLILQDIRKNIKVSQVESAFRAARSAGLQTYGFFIFGHRMDTHSSILETFELAKKIRCDFTSFFLLVPFPGTDIYQYLPSDIKGDWEKIRYINWNKDIDPVSICALPARDLKMYESQVDMEYFGRFSYVVSNIIFRRNNLKFFVLKSMCFARNYLIRMKHVLLGKERVF